MFEQHFYIEGRFMGSVVRPHVVVHAERHPPLSIGYFCGQCGDIWAKSPVTPHQTWDLKWATCPKHVDENPNAVSGSLLSNWDNELNSLLLSCPDIVRWEFERHCEFIERRIAND